MAKILTSQAELDAIFKRISKDFGKMSAEQVEYAIKEIGRVRGEVADLLTEYADSDGYITKRRAGRILRELDEVEKYLREQSGETFEKIIANSSEWTTGRILKDTGITASLGSVNTNVVNYVVKRFGDDGLVLSDRVWGLSGEIRDELSKVIRSNIIKGNGIKAIMKDVRKVYENEAWKIERLARTEVLTSYRTATAMSAEQSDIVEYVQFHDGGPDADHKRHACYALAMSDPYGKGRGVYKPTDTEIYNPHPNCTSYISYILDERWL